MARPVALSTIVERARVHADMRHSGFIKDETALLMLNDIYPKLYDELVAANAHYYSQKHIFALASEVPLPDDFYKLVSLNVDAGGGVYTTLFPFNEIERNANFTDSIPSGTAVMRYIPVPEVFTSLSQEVDGIAGWDRMLSLLLAIDMLDAEESNTDRVYRKYQEEMARIRTSAPARDQGNPATVTDIYAPHWRQDFNWVRYGIRGNNIEFINTWVR